MRPVWVVLGVAAMAGAMGCAAEAWVAVVSVGDAARTPDGDTGGAGTSPTVGAGAAAEAGPGGVPWAECGDADGDGYVRADDCDDGDSAVHPGAAERCNGVDDACDGDVDTLAIDALRWCRDVDADGWGDDKDALYDCARRVGYTRRCGDCDDRDRRVGSECRCLYNLAACAQTGVGTPRDGRESGYGRVAVTGDFDGNGVPDLAISEPYWAAHTHTPGTGAVHIFLGPLDNDLDATRSDAVLLGAAFAGVGGGNAGAALIATDVDADGADDLVIGAPALADAAGNPGVGEVYVVSGAALRPGDQPLDAFAFAQGGSGARSYGAALVGLGDVDQDGGQDFAVVAQAAERDTDVVELWSDDGLNGLIVAVPSLPHDGGSALMGSGIAAVDTDGDGLRELYVPMAPVVGGPVAGVLRFSGDTRGVVTAADALTTFQAEAGASLAASDPGDIDGDGRGDVAFGVYGATSALYVHTNPPRGVVPVDRDVLAEVHNWGFTATAIGDVDGDGVADLLSRPHPDALSREYVFLYLGPLMGDVDEDVAAYWVRGAYDGLSVSGLGDLDGDGLGDFGLGALTEGAASMFTVVHGGS